MSKQIGRNEPCWCGSGRKYKVCHAGFDAKIESYREQGHIVPPHHIIKTPAQIEQIKESCKINIAILDYLEEHIYEGMNTKEIDQIVACLLELFCNSASHIVRSRRSFCSRRFSGSHHDCHPKAHQSDRDGWLVFDDLRHRCFFRIDSDGARHHRRIPRKDDSDSEPHAAVYCAGNH